MTSVDTSVMHDLGDTSVLDLGYTSVRGLVPEVRGLVPEVRGLEAEDRGYRVLGPALGLASYPV